MAKCPNCGGELHPQENGLWKCAECGKLFRMKQKTPPESDMNAGAPQAQTPPASERNVTEPPVQTEPSAPADEAQTAEREELAVLRARIAAMEAKQAELERGATAKQRESGAGAAVLSFLKKWGFKVVLPVGLLLIALITLLVCFCGVRGIYVNIDDPNEFYSFDATNYEYHGIFMGEEYVDKGTWKKSGGQLELTYKDEDFGKVTESYDFSSLDSNNTIFISDDFGNKGEFKRVSLLAYGTSKKIKITLDGNGGSGGDSHKVQIGSKIQEPAEPTRDGYMFMGWYTSKEGWKNAEAKRIDFDDRVWEDVTYYANWKNTTPFNLTGDGLDEPVKFTEGDDVESLYMSARGWNSLPDGVTGLIFKDASGNEIDPSFPPLDNIHVTVVYDVRIENSTLLYVTPVLTEYIIPASVTNIASGAFDGCTELETVYIASRSSALTVQEGAFDECEKLSLVAGYADSTAMRSVLEVSGVTRAHITAGTIASSAFDGCTTLTSVTIGDGVTSIGSYAFNDCTSLTSVTIPDSVTSIGNDAFNGCSAITSATMPSHAIGDIPRDNLKTVVITSGDSIGSGAFEDCTSLTSVIIGDGVTSIGGGAFSECTSLTSVTIGNGVTSIGDEAFEGCTSLTAITIPNSVTTIRYEAFYDCDSLTAITIPDSVTSIGVQAFEYCTSLTSVTIGNSVTSIGGGAFRNCTGLASIHYTGNMASWLEKNWHSNVMSSGRALYIGGTKVEGELVIPNGIASIPSYAFAYQTSITSIIIPDGVTSIGSHAFRDCTSLTSVTIPNSVMNMGNYVFEGCDNLQYNEYGNALYLGSNANPYLVLIAAKNESITSVDIYKSARFICQSAFDGCTSLASVIIPDSVTSIGDYAFEDCTSLASVTIGNSVTSIGERAFYSCGALSSVTIGNGVTSIGYRAFAYCGALISVTIPDSVTSIGVQAFEYCGSLTSITIPDSVTSIGSNAFYDCYKLVEVYNKSSLSITAGSYNYGYVARYAKHVYTDEGGSWLSDTEDGYRFIYDAANDSGYLVGYYGNETELTLPDSFMAYDGTKVTSYQIYDYAFYGRNDLTSITIPDSVTSIGSYAFSGCTSLTSITIPDDVTSIGRYAFRNCKAEIIWGGTPTITQIGEYAFAYYDGTSITIPDSVTSIGDYAFEDCTSLASVTIPDSVTSIGERAFYSCGVLFSVTIGNGVTSIGSSAFYRCTVLTSIHYTGDMASWLEKNWHGKVMSSGRALYIDGTKVEGELVIPNRIASIPSYAFAYQRGITSVTIPNSVTSIGDYAFSRCTSLTSVTFEGTKAEWNAVGKSWLWNYDCPFSVVECSDGNVSV